MTDSKTLVREIVKVIEGRATGWILLDYGSVIVHVFQQESREYYNLERLWTDAKVFDISDILTQD